MIGLIVRADRTGLGQGQTLRLTRLLNPDHILLIDSTPFSQNKQYPQWYKDYKVTNIKGFPTDWEVEDFICKVSTVITCETFYNNNFTEIAKRRGVKTILISNPEFMDWFKPQFTSIPLPDKIIVPSQWRLEEMKQWFNAQYLPTPIFEDEFEKARVTNYKRTGKPRYLFINGKTAVHDRNGLQSIYDSLKYTDADFELVIKAQGNIEKHHDPRLSYDFSDVDEQWKLYDNFDAMILPRRYAGQCLPMCEALMSGLPVVMTDIDPNNKILPAEWLVDSVHMGTFMTRTSVDLYSAMTEALGYKLNTLDTNIKAKKRAYKIGKQFEAENLREQYEELIR